MKLIHLSDLHLGKRINEYSMLEDQEFILEKIIGIIDAEKPDGVIIAGDIYDKSIPPAEAVTLFDWFLSALASKKLHVFIISGNHDSAERIAFGSRIMDASGIHLSPVYDGKVPPITLSDKFGEVNFYLLPFVKPANVRRFYDNENIASYTDAIQCAVSHMSVNIEKRNVLVTHQFVTDAIRSESEDVSVGGTDNVNAAVFEPFDYVALGHLHRPQNCSSEKIRYCGTPLKYSFSEARDKKSVTIVELGAKGSLSVRETPLVPMRDMVEIKGKYNDIMQKSYYENTTYQDDYTHITLTDEEDIVDAIGKIRTVYRNLMKLDYDNTRTRTTALIDGATDVETKSPLELFSDLYELQNNQPVSDEQKEFVQKLIEQIWEDGQ